MDFAPLDRDFQSRAGLSQKRLDRTGLIEWVQDLSYSLTDCVSMVVMRQEGIQDVLTHDRHFAQEGFTVLL